MSALRENNWDFFLVKLWGGASTFYWRYQGRRLFLWHKPKWTVDDYSDWIKSTFLTFTPPQNFNYFVHLDFIFRNFYLQIDSRSHLLHFTFRLNIFWNFQCVKFEKRSKKDRKKMNSFKTFYPIFLNRKSTRQPDM